MQCKRMGHSMKQIEERLSDGFFRRYTSRVFFVWIMVFLSFWIEAALSSVFDSFDRAITGDHLCYISIFFIVFNFLKNTADSFNFKPLTDLIKAMKQ